MAWVWTTFAFRQLKFNYKLTFSLTTPLFPLATYLHVLLPRPLMYIICRCNHILLRITLNNHLRICHVLVNFLQQNTQKAVYCNS
jgi:hypothetical protein